MYIWTFAAYQLDIDIGRVGTSTTKVLSFLELWSCPPGAARSEEWPKGRWFADLETAQRRQRRLGALAEIPPHLVTSGPWRLRGDDGNWSSFPTGKQSTSLLDEEWCRLTCQMFMKCVCQDWFKVADFRKYYCTTRVQDSEDSWGVCTGHGT